MEDFEALPDLKQFERDLRGKAQTREAIRRMLELVRTACEYFAEHTKAGYTGKFIDYGLSSMY